MLRVLEKRDIISSLRRHKEHISTIHFAAREEQEQGGSEESEREVA